MANSIEFWALVFAYGLFNSFLCMAIMLVMGALVKKPMGWIRWPLFLGMILYLGLQGLCTVRYLSMLGLLR